MKCSYINCEEEATTEGFVFKRNEGGGHSPVDVKACDKHKKKREFFENIIKEGEKE
jgi:hypothetical protein